MKVKLQAGAELDLLTAAELHDELEGFRRSLAAERDARVPMRKLSTGTADANGVVIIDLGAPDLRREWEVRAIRLTSVTPGSIKAAQNSYLCIGSQVPGVNDLGAAGVNLNPEVIEDTMFGQQIPWAFSYTGNAHVCRPSEHLFVVIMGTAGVNERYAAGASVLDGAYQLRAARDVRA